MYPVSAGFLPALAAAHDVSVHIDIRRGNTTLYSGLPFTSGTINVDAGTAVRRRLRLTVPPRLSTGTYTDMPSVGLDSHSPLGAYGQEAHVTWGLVYTDGSIEWIPVGVFRIHRTGAVLAGDDTEVMITGVSREAWIADARFVAPRTLSSPSAQSLITSLLKEVLPGVDVVASATLDARVPTFTTDDDRWKTVQDLAESIGAVVYCDGLGRFVIADAPSTNSRPVWTVRKGPGGALVDASLTYSRDGVFNAVVVRGESPSSDVAPVQAVVYDLDPGSQTRWGDPFTGAWGQSPTSRSYPYVTTYDQAAAAALGVLARTVGVYSTMDVSAVPNPALEGGDLIHVVTDDAVRAHVVDALTIPLLAGDDFRISTRDVRSGGA